MGHIVTDLQLANAKDVVTPGVETDEPEEEEKEKLGAGGVTSYRAIAARANYLAQDKADISFTVKE